MIDFINAIMGAGHSHDDHHSLSLTGAFIVGILLNIGFVIIELWAGYYYNSTSLISDAIHNLSDVSALLIALFAHKVSLLKASRRFTYGFKRASVLASFVNSLLIAAAVGLILWEGVQRIINPRPLSGMAVMVVAGIGTLINFGSAFLFHAHKKGDINVKAAYWHLIADALVSVGVVLAGAGMYFTGWFMLDGGVAIVIAFVILYSTWDLFKDSFIAVLDGVPSAIDRDELQNKLCKIEGVTDVHHLHIWSLSSRETALTCHVKIKSPDSAQKIKLQIRKALHELGVQHSTIEFEFD